MTSTEETSKDVDEGSADREDEYNSARSYCEAYCQGEHVLKNEGKSDEDGTQRRERVETRERRGDRSGDRQGSEDDAEDPQKPALME